MSTTYTLTVIKSNSPRKTIETFNLPLPFTEDLVTYHTNRYRERKIDRIIHSLTPEPSVQENITHQYKIIEYLSLLQDEDLIKIFNDPHYRMAARYKGKKGFMSSILTSGFYILYLYVLQRIRAKVCYKTDLKIIFNALLKINVNIHTNKILIPDEDFTALVKIINYLQSKNGSPVFKKRWWNNVISNCDIAIGLADAEWTFWRELQQNEKKIKRLNGRYKFLRTWGLLDLWENYPCYINQDLDILIYNNEYKIKFEILKKIFNKEKVKNINIRNCGDIIRYSNIVNNNFNNGNCSNNSCNNNGYNNFNYITENNFNSIQLKLT